MAEKTSKEVIADLDGEIGRAFQTAELCEGLLERAHEVSDRIVDRVNKLVRSDPSTFRSNHPHRKKRGQFGRSKKVDS
jgi:hypothetical protein